MEEVTGGGGGVERELRCGELLDVSVRQILRGCDGRACRTQGRFGRKTRRRENNYKSE
jgi:hypothetical protein